MSEYTKAREALRQSFKALTDAGYVKLLDVDADDIAVALVQPQAVPLRENPHVAMGRVISREESDKRFAGP